MKKVVYGVKLVKNGREEGGKGGRDRVREERRKEGRKEGRREGRKGVACYCKTKHGIVCLLLACFMITLH